MTKECCFSQIKHMAEYCGLELSIEQINLYIILRENAQETNTDLCSIYNINTIRPQTMTDQQLLAEIIRLTDESCLEKISAAYPNIFPSEKLPID